MFVCLFVCTSEQAVEVTFCLCSYGNQVTESPSEIASQCRTSGSSGPAAAVDSAAARVDGRVPSLSPATSLTEDTLLSML